MVLNPNFSQGWETSVMSKFNFRINGFQFTPRITHFHLPVNTSLFAVNILRPGSDFFLQSVHISNSPTGQALTGQRTEFVLSNIQPTAMFRSIAKMNPTDSFSRPRWFKRFIKGPFGMGIEIITD